MTEPSQTKEEMDFDMHSAEQKKKYIELLSMVGGNFEESKREYNTNPHFRSAINLLNKLQETQLDKEVVRKAIESCLPESMGKYDLKKELGL